MHCKMEMVRRGLSPSRTEGHAFTAWEAAQTSIPPTGLHQPPFSVRTLAMKQGAIQTAARGRKRPSLVYRWVGSVCGCMLRLDGIISASLRLKRKRENLPSRQAVCMSIHFMWKEQWCRMIAWPPLLWSVSPVQMLCYIGSIPMHQALHELLGGGVGWGPVGRKGKPRLGIRLCPYEEKLRTIPGWKEPNVLHLPAGGLLVSGNNARAGAQQWFLLLAASTSEEAMKVHAIGAHV